YEDDYIVANGKYTKNIIHAAGIGEGGFTASTAIALDLVDMAINMLDSAVQKTRLYNPKLEKSINFNSLDFSEKSALISKDINYSKVICKCNNITRGDIVSALKGSVPCESVQAVMRRTNAGKGLCNGSHCALEIAKIISEETHLPLRFVLLSGDYSELGGLLV
ncbi:MAG: (2Fe-2S)-binding protein, partial [Oscillospiraceae bacterium]